MDWKKLLPYISIIIILLITSMALFPDALSGKVVNQPDMLNFRGIGSDVKAYNEETGDVAVWTNSSFSGMPTFIWGGAPYSGNKLKPIQNYVLMLGMPAPPARFFVAFLSFFILMLVLRINPWIGLVGALAFGLCTYNFLISEAGHGSKFLAIIYFPLIAAGAMLVYRSKYILGSILFGFGLGFDIMAGHIQMTYYFAICMGIYVIAKFVEAIKKKELKQFGKASLILLIPMMLAIGSNASRLWTSYEYMKETIRGPQILNTASDDSSSGLDKDYVFDWSHGVAESISFIIPGAFGGGSAQPMDSSFETYKFLKSKGVGRAGLKTAPLYWGDMPFTSGPIYFGAISWFLFIFGLLMVKGPLKWWLLATTALITMLSWGKNFMGFNEFFYNYFPMYDKFRSVNSILAVLQFTVPFLGVLALAELVKENLDRKAALKNLYIALGITGGFVVLFGLLGGAFFDFAGNNDARYAQAGYDVDALMSDRKMMLQSDAFRSLMFILISAGLLWAFIKEKFISKSSILFGALAFFMLIDLGGVGKRYLNSDNFEKPRKYAQNFVPRPVDKQILLDEDPHYRVFDMSISTFNSNRASNHHKTIGGYHAAKLRRYQDIIENQIATGNQKVFDMLNAKYIITADQQLQQNPGAMGASWLVNEIKVVNSHEEEMASLKDFDPRQTAIVHSEFSDNLNGFTGGDGSGSIQLQSIKPNEVIYTFNSNSEQLAVFSEVIYKPNESSGWQSFIDGKPVDHIRANYILRAMKVPAGQHTIEFKFNPPSYYTGEVIATISSLLLILGALGFLFFKWKNSKEL